jgi:hypothetical protein
MELGEASIVLCDSKVQKVIPYTGIRTLFVRAGHTFKKKQKRNGMLGFYS